MTNDVSAAPNVCGKFEIIVPEGRFPGDSIVATTPNGHQVNVAVPEGKYAGSSMTVEYLISGHSATNEEEGLEEEGKKRRMPPLFLLLFCCCCCVLLPAIGLTSFFIFAGVSFHRMSHMLI